MRNKIFFKSFIALLLFLICIGFIYALFSAHTHRQYYEEVNQRLNKELAIYTRDHVVTFNEKNEVDTLAIQKIMQSMMVVNPSIEVYLLDPNGKIINHVAPYKKVKRKSINLEPIKKFIAHNGEYYIKGDDPRDIAKQKVFSAAPVLVDDILKAYYYVILTSEDQASVMSMFRNNYSGQLACKLFLLNLLASALLGGLILWYLTRNISKISSVMSKFKRGEYSTRLDEEEIGDFKELGTTFNQMAYTIEQNIDKIKSVENLRRDLVANVSHDLRTPLSIMQGYLETLILKKKNLSDIEQQQYLERILEGSKKLNGMVEQLFELSQLESNHIELHKEPFLLQELAQDLLQRYKIISQQKNINLELELDGSLPLVYADISLVERVLQNLIDNALKHSPNNSDIIINLSQKNESVKIAIKDSGPGIPEKDQLLIFERYKKSTSNDSQVAGTGLGLAIVKKILEIHNSAIRVTSKPNEGATFHFNLPIFNGPILN